MASRKKRNFFLVLNYFKKIDINDQLQERSAKLKFLQKIYFVMAQLNMQRKWHRKA